VTAQQDDEPVIVSYSDGQGVGLRLQVVPNATSGALPAADLRANGDLNIAGKLLVQNQDILAEVSSLKNRLTAIEEALTDCYNESDPRCRWTTVWQARSTQLGSLTLTYDNPAAASQACDMMVGYVNPVTNQTSNKWWFRIPDAWKTMNPLAASSCDVPVVTATRVSDGLRVTDQLVAGTLNFAGSVCWDSCSAGAYGRFCMRKGTTNGNADFPYYSGYALAGGSATEDWCSTSDSAWNTATCLASNRRFVIFVRARPFCF
jgi:hypothetical protein